MNKIKLGMTDIEVNRTGFGVLPLQRVEKEAAKKLLRKAYEFGIDFYDTARAYSDSEEKIGYALSDVRSEIIIATKTHAKTPDELFSHLEISLNNLKTDYIDIYQLHNMKFVPTLDSDDGLYKAMLKAKELGKIRHIGLTTHSIEIAEQAVDSGLYETIQFPLSVISSKRDLSLIERAKKANVGVIAMKALAGGLIDNAKVAFAFLREYENVIPIWGIQKEWELNEFLVYEATPPLMDKEMKKLMEKYQEELANDFCRGCGYCMPCPVGIPINTAARMSLLLRRAVYQNFLTEEWQNNMQKINDCIHCNQCIDKCPYGLNTPELLQKNLKNYEEFIKNNV